MSALIKRTRVVAIEFAMWRSGRKGGIPWVDNGWVSQPSGTAWCDEVLRGGIISLSEIRNP
jgi:hypothetical protein